MNTKEMKQQENKDQSFNEWAKHTKFGVLWAPTIDEMRFYQDHELRKEIYREVKDLPKIDFEDKPFIEVLVDSVSRLLRIKQ